MALLPPSPFSSAGTGVSAETLVVARSPQAHDAAASSHLSDSDARPVPPAPDEAAASVASQPPVDAAADITETSVTERRIEEALASCPDVGATDCIGEIFAGARKLFDPDPAAYTREDELLYDVLRAMDDPYAADLIDVPEGMLGEFDAPPLFIQQQMRA